MSTDQQTTGNQRPDIELLAAARGLLIVRTFDEQASAAKRRPEFEALMESARRREFEVLIVWAIDRLGRSMANNLAVILELDRLGIEVISIREPWLDTGGPIRPLLVAIFSWVAEQERARLVERTKAGLRRAKGQGKVLGRPSKPKDLNEVRRLRAQGVTVPNIARSVGLSPATVYRALAS